VYTAVLPPSSPRRAKGRGRREARAIRGGHAPHRRCNPSARRGRPDAETAFRSPFSPRQEMAKAPPGREHGGVHRRGTTQPRGKRAFLQASPFPLVGRSPHEDHSRYGSPYPKGPSRSAAAQRPSGHSPAPWPRASRSTAARPSARPDAAPAAWFASLGIRPAPAQAGVRARRRMLPCARRGAEAQRKKGFSRQGAKAPRC
jgi:hypothetical protein